MGKLLTESERIEIALLREKILLRQLRGIFQTDDFIRLHQYTVLLDANEKGHDDQS